MIQGVNLIDFKMPNTKRFENKNKTENKKEQGKWSKWNIPRREGDEFRQLEKPLKWIRLVAFLVLIFVLIALFIGGRRK